MNGLEFRGRFRAYQRTVIDAAEAHSEDGRVHIVAPPGAGKTVIGVELARFFGRPAVVFTPTTTIQQQWIETVAMFSDDPGAVVADDPEALSSLNVFTYQLISTQDHANQEFGDAARRLWAESLVDEGKAETVQAATSRIDEIRANNAEWFSREEARFRRDLRKRLLRDDPSSLGEFLHPNARRLVAGLVAGGVGTVVLDECHHLLDYWALVVRYLISQIDDPITIGLTATPADPQTSIEEENYFALLGEVDFEVPTPALVREGTLAPYRDLVTFVSPTPAELDFLSETGRHLAEAQSALAGTARFRTWLKEELFGAEPGGWRPAWASAVAADALLAFCGLRVLRSLGAAELIPRDVGVPEIAEDEPQFEDWTLVIERFALRVLASSADDADHALLQSVRTSLRPFGLTLTEKGLRRGQSPVDRIVALSDAKASAVADILRTEHESRGDTVRAAVVCDYDREQARAALAGALGAGSARGVHGVLARDTRLVASCCPVLVTATAVAAPEREAERIRSRLLELAGDPDLVLQLERAPGHGVTLIVASEGSWTPKRYVDLVTQLLEAGEIRCVVGTRALLGEGWDARKLNVLVDLTTATTPQSVQQLRGRTIRLDPDDPSKLADNWDVIAWAPILPGGDNDLRRFLRRHEQTWGVVLGEEYERTRAALELAPDAALPAPIERGARHVDPALVSELETLAITPMLRRSEVIRRTQTALEEATARSHAQVPQRDEARNAWGIGGPSDAFVSDHIRVRLAQPGIRTAGYVAETTRSLLIVLAATFVAGALAAFGSLAHIAVTSRPGFLIAVGAAFLGGLALSAGLVVRVLRRLLVEQPPDVIVLDIGRAVALALADAELISMSRDTALRSVWCKQNPQKELEVGLSGSADDQRLFSGSMREVFAISGDARYLIRRTNSRLPSFLGNLVWKPLRALARALGAGESRDNFLAVPRVLARSRKRVESFARHWSRHVGGGELVDTRDPEAATAILEARGASRIQALAEQIRRYGENTLM